MKTTLSRIPCFIVIAGLFLSSAVISCTKDDMGDNNGQTYGTSGNASGAQQNPAVATTGTGSLTGTYNTKTNNWEYTISWTALTGVASAVQLFGPADSGMNGNFLFALNLTTPGINGSASGSVLLTEEQEAWLIAGKLYYTVLTATNITGEIRGQITASTR